MATETTQTTDTISAETDTIGYDTMIAPTPPPPARRPPTRAATGTVSTTTT